MPEDEQGMTYVQMPRPSMADRSKCPICQAGLNGDSFLLASNVYEMKKEFVSLVLNGAELLGARKAFVYYQDLRKTSVNMKNTVRGYEKYEDLPEWSPSGVYEHFMRHTNDPILEKMRLNRENDYTRLDFYRTNVSVKSTNTRVRFLDQTALGVYRSMSRDQSKSCDELNRMLGGFDRSSKKKNEYRIGWGSILGQTGDDPKNIS